MLSDQSPGAPPRHAASAWDTEALRTLLIGKMRQRWIVEALAEALTDSPPAPVYALNSPSAVLHPSGDTISQSREAQRTFKGPNTAFSHHNHSLLILGERGAGKSSYLYLLLRTLLRRADQDPSAPIPVVFNLAAWNHRRGGLAVWMAREVERFYGIPAPVFQDWLIAGNVIPLFDRLDEIPTGNLIGHIDAVNVLKRTNALPGIAVCIRTDKYYEASTRIELDGAVTLQPISSDRIDQLLQRRDFDHVRYLTTVDSRLNTLLQNRLALTLAFRVQHDLTERDITEIWANGDEPLAAMLGLYVDRLYGKYPQSKWSERKTRHWLHWLACYMTDHGIGVLHPLWIQPNFLPNRLYQKIVTVGSAVLVMFFLLFLSVSIGLFLIYVPSGWEYNNLPNSLMLALFLVLVVCIGVFAGYDSSITPIARAQWVWPLNFKQFSVITGVALVVGTGCRRCDDHLKWASRGRTGRRYIRLGNGRYGNYVARCLSGPTESLFAYA